MTTCASLFIARADYQMKSRNIEQQLLSLKSELEILKVDDDSMMLDPQHSNLAYPSRNEVFGTYLIRFNTDSKNKTFMFFVRPVPDCIDLAPSICCCFSVASKLHIFVP